MRLMWIYEYGDDVSPCSVKVHGSSSPKHGHGTPESRVEFRVRFLEAMKQ